MVNFTFTKDSVPKIKANKKWATTRPPTPFWVGLHNRFNSGQPMKMHLWAGSPRSKGVLIGEEPMMESRMVKGKDFTEFMALADGFEQRDELMLRLAQLYHPRMCEDCKRVEGSWHFTLNPSHIMGYKVKAPGPLLQWALETEWTWWLWQGPVGVV